MNDENQIKKHPGQAGSDDGEQLKRTKVIEINLSPVELKSFKDAWRKTEFNSMAKFARYKLFGGQEHKIDLYWDFKDEERNINKNLLSQLNKLGNNMNQIAKQLNSKPEFLRQEATELLKSLKSALDEHERIRQEVMGKNKK